MGRGTPSFDARLVNGAFGDPGVLVDCAFARRALLFDLGDLEPLPVRKLLRVTEAFVSHAHMDHFIGFDQLLRACLGRPAPLTLYGPPGMLARTEAKLAAYTWDRDYGIEHDFAIRAIELDPTGAAKAAWFRSSRQFRREQEAALALPEGAVVDEPRFRVRAAFLDHRTASMAFALEERTRVHVNPEALAGLGLAPGPWVSALKHAVATGQPPARELPRPIAELRRALEVAPGQKIAYVTDALYSDENSARIVGLARDADILFIEAVFADEDAALGAKRCHLTAGQAGRLAREARAKSACLFHHSPRYRGREDVLRRQFADAFGGKVTATSPAAGPRR